MSERASRLSVRIGYRQYGLPLRPYQIGRVGEAAAVPCTGRRQGQPAGRLRSPEAYGAILAATQSLLEENGFNKLTIEGVAARACVGKATIYRWWPTKSALVVEAALAAIAPASATAVARSARKEISAQLRRTAKAIAGRTGKIVREVIGAGQFDPETMHLFDEGYLKPRRIATKQVLQRGIEQGEFRKDIDLDAVTDALYAPLYHRLLVGHESNDEQFLGSLYQLILNGIAIPL